MKIVRVTYTTTPEYAAQNQENIRNVMSTLRSMNVDSFRYETFLAPDGKSFTHLAVFNNDESEKILLTLKEFIYFQEQLKASKPEAPPKQEILSLVGSSVAS